MAVISMKKAYAGHAKRLMFGLWSYLRQFMYTKFIVVVDEDIDIRDWNEVIWAITRMTRSATRRWSITRRSTISISRRRSAGSEARWASTRLEWPGETNREWGRPITLDGALTRDVEQRLDAVFASVMTAAKKS